MVNSFIGIVKFIYIFWVSYFSRHSLFWKHMCRKYLISDVQLACDIKKVTLPTRCPNFGKSTLFVCIYGLNSHLKFSFRSTLEKKHQNLPLQNPTFVCSTRTFYRSAIFQTTSPTPKIQAVLLNIRTLSMKHKRAGVEHGSYRLWQNSWS